MAEAVPWAPTMDGSSALQAHGHQASRSDVREGGKLSHVADPQHQHQHHHGKLPSSARINHARAEGHHHDERHQYHRRMLLHDEESATISIACSAASTGSASATAMDSIAMDDVSWRTNQSHLSDALISMAATHSPQSLLMQARHPHNVE